MSGEAPYGWLVIDLTVEPSKIVSYIEPGTVPAHFPEGCVIAPLPGWLNVKRGLVDYIAMRERREVYRR